MITPPAACTITLGGPPGPTDEEQIIVKAFVLIVTDPGATRRVATALKDIDHVTDVHEVMGPYDIVAELEAPQLPDIPPILSEHIRTMDGIQSTTSLVAFPV